VLPKHEVRFDRGRVRDAFGRVPALQHFSRSATYLSFESRALGFTFQPKLLAPWAKAHAKVLAGAISDEGKRKALTPTDPMGCKRVLLSNDFYPAVADPKVAIETEKIVAVTPAGVQTADGVEHELDVLVYGTGFAATRFLAGIEVHGPDGADLQAEWSAAGGAESFRGGTVAGFPNLAVLYGPNTNLAHNSIILMLEGQYRHLLTLLTAAGAGSVAPRPEAQQAWNRWVSERMQRTAFVAGCHSWYATPGGKQTNNWPSFTASYRHAHRHGARGLDPADYLFSAAG
jgi:cation diffusion facilitator CzcD-associated flavoprotein CzcO